MISTNQRGTASFEPLVTRGVEFRTEPRQPTLALLHQLFEEQTRRTPNALAVVCRDVSLTYDELNQRANALAYQLRELGVVPESLVGLYLERSVELLIGLLGIVKAGGAYVPLEPQQPPERLAAILTESKMQVLVSQPELCARLIDLPPRYVLLDNSAPATRLPDPEPVANGDNLAYVIYTSGSTGAPKGVMIEHAAVVNTVLDINRRFGINASDRVLALSSYGFDLSVYDVFGLLAVGGAAVLPDQELARQPAHWARLLVEHRVTVWNTVPASMEMLISHLATLTDKPADASRPLDSLRLVMLSGDWIPLPLPGLVRELNAHAKIVSLGGATEASIWSVLFPIEAVDPQWKSIPYGRAMNNQTMHVLDDQLQPCETGVVGQIHIGGAGLARGYFNRPDLTARQFIADPFAVAPAARLYATGDLGRWMPDGNIEFLGRVDGQVKIRGYRIEVGEIEAALCRHPAVRAAVVVPRETVPGHKMLAAFIVPSESNCPTPRELRVFLRKALPEYMIPSQFAAIDALPLTSNGKVDRKSLIASDSRLFSAAAAPYQPPSDDIESQLVEVWQLGFNFPQIGIDDDFFAIGGDSLLAVGLFAEIEDRLGRELSFNVLLNSPTIRQLATLLREANAEPRSPLVTIQAGDDRPPLFCLPGILGSLLEFHDLAVGLGADQPVYGLRPQGIDGREAPQDSIVEMARICVAEIRARQPRGPYHLAGYSMGGAVAFEIAQQLTTQHEQVGILALLDSRLIGQKLPLAGWLRLHWNYFWQQDWAGRLRYLRARAHFRSLLSRRAKTPSEHLKTKLSPARERMFCTHIQALLDYSPQVYPGPITLFKAADLPPEMIDTPDDRHLLWAALSTLPIEVHCTPGDHDEILKPINVRQLASKLRTCLDRVGLAQPQVVDKDADGSTSAARVPAAVATNDGTTLCTRLAG